MSRMQNILDKAEREGAMLRTSRLAPPPVTALPPDPSVSALSPVAHDIPPVAHDTPPIAHDIAIVPGAAAAPALSNLDSVAAAAHLDVRLNPLLVAGLAPKSPAAEQYRQLRTRLGHSEGAQNLRSVLVTSPQKGEGKSITAANLALTMAQELHRKVVIVEADLRKPSLQHLFGLPSGPGLTDYLAGAADLESVMQFLPAYQLTVIAAGTSPANPAELLGSTAMRRMLDQLRSRFDRVILDTPPVLPLADVAVLAPMVDGALLVVRAGVTPKPAIENALRAFDSSRLLGVVLNESGLEEDYRYEGPRH
jgi:capsular exopolysaccharide synthesis family protein